MMNPSKCIDATFVQAEIANGKTVFCADKSNTLPETNKAGTIRNNTF